MRVKQYQDNPNASIYFYHKGLIKYVGVMLKGKIEVLTDQETKNMIWNSTDPGAKDLQERIDRQEGRHILHYAKFLGLGTREYDLIDIDTKKSSTLIGRTFFFYLLF